MHRTVGNTQPDKRWRGRSILQCVLTAFGPRRDHRPLGSESWHCCQSWFRRRFASPLC